VNVRFAVAVAAAAAAASLSPWQQQTPVGRLKSQRASKN
jgi:hypothetical protein